MTDCPYAKNDTAPCFQRGRMLAGVIDKGMLNYFCRACFRRVYPTNHELIELEAANAPPPRKKRH